MARNPSCTVFIGNLDEKVHERVLYEILIQAGHVVDLYIPRDKETNCPKRYAFVEYESEEIAGYAVRLFSGLVCLHNKTLRFAISGQNKPSEDPYILATSKPNPPPIPNTYSLHAQDSKRLQSMCRLSAVTHSVPSVYPEVHTSGYVNGVDSSNFGHSRHARHRTTR